MPESQVDRFLLRIPMGYPETEAEKDILRRNNHIPLVENLQPVLKAEDIIESQKSVSNVRVDESLLDQITNHSECSNCLLEQLIRTHVIGLSSIKNLTHLLCFLCC